MFGKSKQVQQELATKLKVLLCEFVHLCINMCIDYVYKYGMHMVFVRRVCLFVLYACYVF